MNSPHTQRRQFASDNFSGICPEAWEALREANQGHARSYGDDPWTAKAADQIREIFEKDCEVFFVFNGTAANSLALSSLCQSYHSVLCSETAHAATDECGAPEFFSNGTKLLTLPAPGGKIEPEAVESMVRRRTDIHYPKPRVVSVTQATELGTLYVPEELRAIGDTAKRLGLHVHMDGARFANAIAALGVAPREITWDVGVDVLCLGGSKNGLALGEAVVFFDRELAKEFDYRCKQAGQLASKMRFLSAPWVAILRDGIWLRHAGQANRTAAKLESALREIPGVRLMWPREANSVFAQLPTPAVEAMHARGWIFYSFIGQGGCRLMCSWDTSEADVRDFAEDLRDVMC